MENAGEILSAGMVLVTFVSLVLMSGKTGIVSYSAQSLSKMNRPKYKVDKAKIWIFLVSLLAVFIISFNAGLLITMGDVPASALFGGYNMTVSSFALTFWVLLKEKK